MQPVSILWNEKKKVLQIFLVAPSDEVISFPYVRCDRSCVCVIVCDHANNNNNSVNIYNNHMQFNDIGTNLKYFRCRFYLIR